MQWIRLESAISTNSYISALLKQGKAQEELVVIADYQEEGRGQGNHSWHSDKGQNLLMSMLLFPAFLSASRQFQLSRMVSLAICDVLAEEDVNPVIKWPNDILTGHGKIAGILIENSIIQHQISHTIIGIGMNLNQTSFPEFPVKATSLILERGTPADPREMAEVLVRKIVHRYEQLRNGTGINLEEEYLNGLYLYEQPALFNLRGKKIRGNIQGVNDFGELLVESAGTVKAFGHQEIQIIGP